MPLPGVLIGYRVVPVIYSNRIRVREEPLPGTELAPYQPGARVPAPLIDTTLPAPLLPGLDAAEPDAADDATPDDADPEPPETPAAEPSPADSPSEATPEL